MGERKDAMLSYKEFEKAVVDTIRSYLPPDKMSADISVREITRSNDRKAAALLIREEGNRITPNIYLEDYYKMYQQEENLDEILKSIADAYEQSRGISDKVFSINPFEFENVKNKLYITVMNEALNTDYLANKVHITIPGTDLSAVVRVMCSKEEHSSFAVSEEMAAQWDISEDELYKLALKNSERILPVILRNMSDIVTELSAGRLQNAYDSGESADWKLRPCQQYVLSNEDGLDGASAMLYEGVLKKISEETGGNIFILPSSLHELILMKDTGVVSVDELQNTVMSINRSQVRPEDLLSDEVYYYDVKEQKLTMATDPEQTKIYQEQMDAGYEYANGSEPMQETDWDEELER